MADEQGEQKEPEEQKLTIILDPSKFTINAEGQVIVTDPAFVEALRAAIINEEAQGHGVGFGVVVGL
jgi:hypothetical protein